MTDSSRKPSEPIRTSFIITSLGAGGAQMMLLKLLQQLDRKKFDPEVISLSGLRPETCFLLERYRSLGIKTLVFNLNLGPAMALQMASLIAHLRRRQPRLVSTWMYHADLMGGLAARLAGRFPVVWNIRHSNLDRVKDKKSTVMVADLCARLSKYLPQKIICCARDSQITHSSIGYDQNRMLVIPNGFFTDEYVPDPELRMRSRKELGIEDDFLAIGMFGRYHPHKGHKNFFQAAEIFVRGNRKVRFVLCGFQVDWENQEIADSIRKYGMEDYFLLLGQQADMPRLYSALDILASASVCEGFSNVIGEAMSCGVPCAVTDVGDSAWIVGDTGMIVSPNSPEELAQALIKMTEIGQKERTRLGISARERIVDNFSIPKIVRQYEDLFECLVKHNENVHGGYKCGHEVEKLKINN
ncbi:MAG: glycosyltransferase [Syntrophotaleaceae bacterium]